MKLRERPQQLPLISVDDDRTQMVDVDDKDKEGNGKDKEGNHVCVLSLFKSEKKVPVKSQKKQ